MYIPKLFLESDAKTLIDFMRRYSFASLVSNHEGRPFATHLPFLIKERDGQVVLVGHMARGNPQWKSMFEQEVLTVFTGPHCYVSPVWYYLSGQQKSQLDANTLAAQDARHVPTWNYTAVHVYGTPNLIEGDEAVHLLLRELADHFESQRENPWRMELPEEYRLGLQAAIVAFEIVATRIEGKFKLNQNRRPEERAGVIEALSQKNSENERGVYELMLKLT